MGQVEWAGNSHELLIEKLSRFRNEREFLLADVRTGAIRRIFHESDPAWVVASYGTNAGLTWIRDGQAFIVLSEKDGWRHAYVYSRDGQELALLTPGPYDIIERAVVDEAGGWFYYYASPDNATQKYLYRVRLDGTAEPERVTPADQPGTHDYDFSPDAKWAFHTYSTFDTPPVTELVQLPEHRVVRVLEDNQELRKKMESLISQPTEFFQLEIGDGVVMDAWMIKPGDFDPSRKYPVLVYVYGEPHAQTVLDAWGTVHADYHRLIADLGYLVVSIDNRGTPAPKGAAWRRAIFGSLGPLSTEEQAAGVKELAPHPPLRRPVPGRHLGLEWRRLEHPERDVPQAGCLSRGDRRRAQAAAASLQCVVPGDLHGDPRDESGRIPPVRANQLCRRLEGRPADHSRYGRDQHPSSDHRRAGGSPDRIGQAVRLHGVSQS